MRPTNNTPPPLAAGGGITASFRYRCLNCAHIGVDSDLLQAANPFKPDSLIFACPECREVDCFERLCDEVGCRELAGCGTPYPGGYKQHCHRHPPLPAPPAGGRGE